MAFSSLHMSLGGCNQVHHPLFLRSCPLLRRGGSLRTKLSTVNESPGKVSRAGYGCLRNVAPQAAAAAAAAAAAPFLGNILPPAAVFSTVSALMVPIYFLMAGWPRAKLTRTVIDSPVLHIGLAAVYMVILIQCWQEGILSKLLTVVKSGLTKPDVARLGALLGQPLCTALAWVHLLLLDFMQAREVLADGLARGLFTAHSVILCFFFGPLGILSHVITRSLKEKPQLKSS